MNVTTVPKFTYEDGNQVGKVIITDYKTKADNTELALGHLRIYFPDISGGNQIYKDHFTELATILGRTGAIIPSDTPFRKPKNKWNIRY